LSRWRAFHYGEQWKNYRSTEQLPGHEKFLFLSRVGRYADLDGARAFHIFVDRVEDAIATENSATLNVMTMAAETTETTKKPSDVKTYPQCCRIFVFFAITGF
jgi:hypothetical protein